jgi:hypothetical protein
MVPLRKNPPKRYRVGGPRAAPNVPDLVEPSCARRPEEAEVVDIDGTSVERVQDGRIWSLRSSVENGACRTGQRKCLQSKPYMLSKNTPFFISRYIFQRPTASTGWTKKDCQQRRNETAESTLAIESPLRSSIDELRPFVVGSIIRPRRASCRCSSVLNSSSNRSIRRTAT